MHLRNLSKIKELSFNIRDVETGSVTASYCCNDSVISVQTRCSAIAERPRCRVRYSLRQK